LPFIFFMSQDPRKTEDGNAAALTAMREPPGRLGDIVRRLKLAQPLPSRISPPTVSSGEANGT
jgi:hypothetical protein